MRHRTYTVLRPVFTDAGGDSHREYRVNDVITIDDDARAVYYLDAGFIARIDAVASPPGIAATSDAPERADVVIDDGDAESMDADPAPSVRGRRRTRGAF